jgi:hypothetical protein
MLRDKVTNEEREVDVLVRARAVSYEVSIGIEVVSWGRRAGAPSPRANMTCCTYP